MKGHFSPCLDRTLSKPSPQRTPVLFQARASPKGKRFAAKHAEALFTKHHSLDALKIYSNDIRTLAKEYGRIQMI